MTDHELQLAIAAQADRNKVVNGNLFSRSNLLSHINAEEFIRLTVAEVLIRLQAVDRSESESLHRFLQDEQLAFYSDNDNLEGNPSDSFALSALGRGLEILSNNVRDRFDTMYDPQIELSARFGNFLLNNALQEVQDSSGSGRTRATGH